MYVNLIRIILRLIMRRLTSAGNCSLKYGKIHSRFVSLTKLFHFLQLAKISIETDRRQLMIVEQKIYDGFCFSYLAKNLLISSHKSFYEANNLSAFKPPDMNDPSSALTYSVASLYTHFMNTFMLFKIFVVFFSIGNFYSK